MIRCPSWPQPPMEDHVVLLNLLSLTWVAMDQASPLREAHKEQVCLQICHNYLNLQCNLDLVTLHLVTTCYLVTILQRPFLNLKINPLKFHFMESLHHTAILK
jgi:hypothetical protein